MKQIHGSIRAVHLCLFTIMFLLLSTATIQADHAAARPFSVAFCYAVKPPLDELKAFDIVVVDPDAVGIAPQQYKTGQSELFAYVSTGEADPNRNFYQKINPAWLVGDNTAWKSKLVDLTNPAWRTFFLDKVVEPLWQAGYRGFFLDTLDSYQLVPDKGRHFALEAGLVQVIRSIKQRHPEARLILNRGFEVLDRVKDVTFAVAAESLFQNFDPATGAYGEVKENDRQWLLGKFAEVRKAGLPVIAIDYVAPGNRELARKTAEKIKALGFIPWVTDKDLASLGVGSVEVLPRKILGLYDGSEGPDPIYTNLHRFAVMPLNYLGYQVELHELQKPLPQGVLKGTYSGILIWSNSDSSRTKNNLLQWIIRQKKDGVPLVFLDRFGMPPQQFAKEMGGLLLSDSSAFKDVKIMKQDPMVGFETTAVPGGNQSLPIRFPNSEVLFALGNGHQIVSEAVAVTPWGGYALEPYLLNELLKEQARWVINPFEFFRKTLRLEGQPAPDTTTENGLRLLFSHIDADGFESMVERPGGPLAATELRERILKRYRIPITYSIITSTLGDHGLNPGQAQILQEEARKIFALPWVEAGSHTFSHPFYWQNTETAKQGYNAQYLPIPGYTFNVASEIAGSAAFINHNLLPPGKKTRLLQWSGDCSPGADALSATYAASLGNINGGDTLITESNRSVTAVAPLGVEKGGWFQVFAPNQNENVYTNLWTGPFYGYRRVIETFQLTDVPRRLKPINIYYHTYSVTKEASRKALEDVHSWALAQKPHAIYTSEYVDKVLDFNRTVVAKDGNGWLIRNAGDLRQVRLPVSAGYPNLQLSRNVPGFHDHGDSRYIHLGPGGEASLVLQQQQPDRPWLKTVGGAVTAFTPTQNGMRLAVRSYLPTDISFGGAAKNCRLMHRDGTELKVKRASGLLTAELPAGSHTLELSCR